MYDRILVPVDGSAGADRAVEHALDLAGRYGADVHAMFVVDTRLYGEPALSSAEIIVEEIEDEGQRLLDEVAARAADRDIEVERRCCHGVPHDEIIAYADEVGADIVVMGFHGRTHEQRLGSVVERVVRAGARPVLVV